MASDTLIVRVRPGETRIARADTNNRLKDFAVYRTGCQDQGAHAGDIYLGRVKAVVPAMEAAFVDLGLERDAFLGLGDARPNQVQHGRERITDLVHEGESLMVQVLAEARDDKGAKISRRVTVAGRACVLTPGDPGVRVSKRVRDEAERSRLRAQATAILTGDEGCVVRSAALGLSERALQGELKLLHVRWSAVQELAKNAKMPVKLSGDEQPALQFLSEIGHGGIHTIVVDDSSEANQLATALEKLDAVPQGGIERHPGGSDVFVECGVADEVEAILSPKVALKSGGSLIIEETQALTAIDVNAGRGGEGRGGKGADLGLATNLEAVKEAARQMRVRNLGGLIVIDLMPMKGADAAGRVVAVMKDAVAMDPAGPFVLGISKAGLLELTRPRRRAALSQVLLRPASRTLNDLSVGLEALERVLAQVWAEPGLIPALRAPSHVIEALKQDAPQALKDMEAKLGHPLDLVADDALGPGRYKIEPQRNDK